ncbi:MAG: carboxypeptidase regulatory-like domain-containing protein [Muribaculaceae bacterium]|nr:carboxypeptidase regulatory-like domain-containing protein [Muribaculaceae bacterium]
MKVKKLLLATSVALLSLSASAANPEDVRIYINPGHGGFNSGDRPMSTIKHGHQDNYSVSSDTSSFFESNTNLQKGFGMLEKLKEYGVPYNNSLPATSASQTNIRFSRVASGGSANGTYDREMSTIAAEAETWNADIFVSIHSNATTGDHNELTHLNHCLYLYRGYDGDPSVKESDKMAAACWPHSMKNKHMHYNWLADPTRPRDKNYTEGWTWGKCQYYPSGNDADGNPYWIKGDLSFNYYKDTEHYGDYYLTNGVYYKGYYAVLRHSVPGFLVEGYDHTYKPATHRAMNDDVCRHEGEIYARGLNDYYGWGKKDNYGKIYGIVRDHSVVMTHEYYAVKAVGSTKDANQKIDQIDNKKPLNNVRVGLYNEDGVEIDYYITDDEWNGAYIFKKVAPGTYTIKHSRPGYGDVTKTVTVIANETNYIDIDMRTNTASTAVRGHYAYDLSASQSGTNNVLKFKSTGAMPNAKIILTNTTSGEQRVVETGAVSEGENTVTISGYTFNEDAQYTWAVAFDNPISTGCKQIHSDPSVRTVGGRLGVAIDNDQTSPRFGAIYTIENLGGGIQRINPDFTKNGGVVLKNTFGIGGSNYTNRITTSNGKVYIANYSGTNPGVWVYNPGLSTENKTNITNYYYERGVAFNGKGSKRIMYTTTTTSSSACRIQGYVIGESDSWSGNSSNPSNGFTTTLLINDGNILATDKGVIVSQWRYKGNNSSSKPAFVAYSTNIDYDAKSMIFYTKYNSSVLSSQLPGTESAETLTGHQIGGMAITSDYKTFAIVDGYTEGSPSNVKVHIYQVTWDEKKPWFNHQYSITLDGTYQVDQMDFDHAGNLYIASQQKGLLVYAIKNPARQTTTNALSISLVQGLKVVAPTNVKASRKCYGEGSNSTEGTIDAEITWDGIEGSNYKIYYQTMRRDASGNRVYDNGGTWVELGTTTIASGSTSGSFTHKNLVYGSDANGNYDRIYNYKVATYDASTGLDGFSTILEGKGNTVTSFYPSAPVDVALSQPTETNENGLTLYSFDLQLNLALNENFSTSRIDDADAMSTVSKYVIVVDEETAKWLNNASNVSEIGTFVQGPVTIIANNCTHHAVDGWYLEVDFDDIKPSGNLAVATKTLTWKNVNPSVAYKSQVYAISTRAFNYISATSTVKDNSDADALTMTLPSPQWISTQDDGSVGVVTLEGDYSSLVTTDDYPMGTFRKVGDIENPTNPVTITRANYIGSLGAMLQPLAVTDDIMGTRNTNGIYENATWNIAYTFKLYEKSGEEWTLIREAQKYDQQSTDANVNSLYSNTSGLSFDITGMSVGADEVAAPDGRKRLVYNPQKNKEYKLVVETNYRRYINGEQVHAVGVSENLITINPTFAAPSIIAAKSPGFLFMETATHWDENCTTNNGYYKYYYDAAVDVAWNAFNDNLARYMGFHATPKFNCVGHYEDKTSTEWSPYYAASVLTDSQVESYNIRKATSSGDVLTKLGYSGKEDWSTMATEENHIPLKVHYVWAGNDKIADTGDAEFGFELSANYPIVSVETPEFKINEYPQSGAYEFALVNPLSRSTSGYELQMITSVNKEYKTLVMDGIIETPTTGVENVGTGNGALRLYPNPANSVVTLQAPITITDVKIFTVDGQLMKEFDADDTKVKINVSDLPTGVYIVHAAGSTTRLIKR